MSPQIVIILPAQFQYYYSFYGLVYRKYIRPWQGDLPYISDIVCLKLNI